MRWPFSFAVLSRLLGAVLLLAGAATAYDALDASGGLTAVTWLHAASGAGEIAFGLWLLVGLYPRLSWWLLVGCFITFLGVSFDRAITGESSCGCFGRFHVAPWYTFTFDAAAVLALACVQPSPQQVPAGAGVWRRLAVYASLLFVAMVGLAASAYPARAHLSDEGEAIGSGAEVLLSPQDWVGRRFPLARHIDVGPTLMDGRWVVMFYRPDCSLCRAALPEFVGLAYHLSHADRSTRVALVEVPREDGSPSAPSRSGLCLRGRLSDERRWRIRTPSFLLLDGGTVTKVPDQLEGVYRELGVRGGEDEEPAGGILFPDYAKVRRDMFLQQIACGPLALIRVLESLGKPLTEEEAEQLVDEAGDKGIDMLRLKELAEQHGLHSLGIAVSPQKLRQIGQRAIVYLDGAGFAPVLGYTRDGVIVAYPLAPAGVLPDDLFARSFGAQGKALLLSETPLSPARLGLAAPGATGEEKPQGPHLRPERSILAVGRLHRKNWEASLTLTNDGSEPLSIKGIDTSCTCFTAAVDRKSLAPGEATELRAKGTQSQAGGFTWTVSIATNESPGSPLRLPVRGYLEPPAVFNPPVVFLHQVLPQEKAEADVQVELPRRTNFSSLRLTGPKEGPLTGQLVRREQGAALKVRWAGAKEPGTYRGEFALSALDAKDAATTTLACAVEVVPVVTVFPPSLWIEGPAGDSWTRKLSVESRHDLVGELSLRWSDEAAGKAIQARVKKEGPRALGVTLSGKIAAGSGSIVLTIVAGDQSLSVPVRFVPTIPQ